jgi:hypothetical protein
VTSLRQCSCGMLADLSLDGELEGRCLSCARKIDPRLCDLSKGDVQCPSILRRGDESLSCRFRKGHTGLHKTGYFGGARW